MTHFAGIASEVEAVIGVEQTRTLLAARGGTQISIPVRAANSSLAALIGEAAARQMIDAFGAGALRLPMGVARGRAAKRQQAIDMLNGGASLSQVALACEIHVRTVSRYRAEAK